MRTQRCVVLTGVWRVVPFLSAVIIVPSGWAQDTSSLPSAPSVQRTTASRLFDLREFESPKSHFPNPVDPYRVHHATAPNLLNTPRIDQFLHDGKLYLSINDAVALALENNLDLAIARYNLSIADTDIWRAAAGSSITGVNSGLVQNTPGGGEGGLGGHVGPGQGGTSVAAGGAGAGAGGLVGSTLGGGPETSSFDPVLASSLSMEHAAAECNTPLCATNQNSAGANFTYSQGFHWGTDMAIEFDNSRVTSNSVYTLLSPALNSNFRIRLTQHLLQGFGPTVNTRYIRIAKNNREISDVAFRYQIAATVDQIENMYWDLVFAYETARVQKEQLSLAQKTLANNQKQVEIGAMAPLEVVRAQSTIAADEQAVTHALTNLELEQLLMKNAISRTLVDPVLVDAEVIPTSTIELPSQEAAVPTQDLVDEALHHRPELAEARINLTNTEISNKAIRSALLPSLDLSAFYGGAGLGGRANPSSICITDPQVCSPRNPSPQAPSVSYGQTLSQLVDSSAPDKGIALSLSIPIRNRAAQATQVRSEFEYRQAQLRIQQLENQIRIEVRSAQFGVQQTHASIASAQAAVDLARQSLESEEKKYELRASTSILVLQNQTALAQAEATLISAKVDYEKALLELDRSVGLLLDHAGILINDAERGRVTQMPSVPHAATARPPEEATPVNPPVQP
jgi:outer membrane protein